MTIESIHIDDVMSQASHPVKPVPEHGKPINLFFKLEDKLAKLMRFVMVAASLTLGFLMAAQVLMRYGLESPFLGVEELAPMLALWAYFLGMAYSTRERDHISGGIITLIFKSPRVIDGIRFVGTLACLAATGIFGYYAWTFSMFNFNLGRTSIYMGWPKYLWDFSMVAGFALMGFYYVLQAIAEVRQLAANQTRRQD